MFRASLLPPKATPDPPMPQYRPITLLHLSDLQFGDHGRFAGRNGLLENGSFATLLRRLTDDLAFLKRGEGLEPDLVLLTGGLVEKGRRPEFREALDFVTGLADALELPRRRIVAVPGNHDINWNACASYFERCKAYDEQPVEPYWDKWCHWQFFFESLYRDCPGITFTPEAPWTLFEIPELRLVVAGLNSTIKESHRREDRYGYLGETQIRWFTRKLEHYRDMGWMRIGALHHNAVRGAGQDEENLRDADRLKRVLGPYLNAILHGHPHQPGFGWLNKRTPILWTGSASVGAAARMATVTNQHYFGSSTCVCARSTNDDRTDIELACRLRSGRGWLAGWRAVWAAAAGRCRRRSFFPRSDRVERRRYWRNAKAIMTRTA
jgi:3',5'-cyclic AMP phosphodiesterase CpdA